MDHSGHPDLHVWTLTSGVLATSCHIVMADESSSQTAMLDDVSDLVRNSFQIDHTTIQIEEAGAPQEVFESCHCHFGA
jgi:Co/Zn/Cd efflux system component